MPTNIFATIKKFLFDFGTASSTKDIQDLHTIINILTQIWNQGNIEALSEYFTEDVIYIYSGILTRVC